MHGVFATSVLKILIFHWFYKQFCSCAKIEFLGLRAFLHRIGPSTSPGATFSKVFGLLFFHASCTITVFLGMHCVFTTSVLKILIFHWFYKQFCSCAKIEFLGLRAFLHRIGPSTSPGATFSKVFGLLFCSCFSRLNGEELRSSFWKLYFCFQM